VQLTIRCNKQPGRQLSWLFLAIPFIAIGQSTKTSNSFSIHGFVKSQFDSSAIEGVHIYLRNTTIGTVSNRDGEFKLNIPDSLDQKELLFSAVGFRTESSPTYSARVNDILIYLKPSLQLLAEVLVTANRLDSSQFILSEAVRLIKSNYPKKNHQLEGFYRAISTVDTIYTRLIEAAILIQEIGYQKDTWEEESLTMTKNRIKVIEIRKSDDFREKGLLTRALSLIFGERNDLYQLLNTNYVRLLGRKSNHVMGSNNLLKFESEYLGPIEWDGKLAYSIVLKNQPVGHFQWDEINFLINKEDYGILRIELKREASPNRKDIPRQSLIEGKYFFKGDITYRKINQRYYPVLIHTVGSDYDASNTVEIDGKVLKQSSEQIFLLTNIHEEKFSKIKNKESEERDTDIYKIDRPYNAYFWKTYNTVLINPLKRTPSELEKNRSLEEQFRDSKKKND
jgi:hypothetical protein